MLYPPQNFRQLKALSWAAPAIGVLGVGLACKTHGATPTNALIAALGAAAVAWALAMVAVWRSGFGTRHQFVTIGAGLTLFVWPWGVMTIPLAVPHPHALAVSMIAICAQLLLLVIAVAWHGRRLSDLSGQKFIQWPGTRIDVARSLIHASDANVHAPTPWATPGAIGVLAVLAFQGLRSLLGGDALVLGAATLGWGMGAWLICGPLARACAQAWKQRQIEKREGIRFRSERVTEWLPLRQASVWGRRH